MIETAAMMILAAALLGGGVLLGDWITDRRMRSGINTYASVQGHILSMGEADDDDGPKG